MRTPSLTHPNLLMTLHTLLLDSGWCYKSLGQYNVKFQVTSWDEGEAMWVAVRHDAKVKIRSKWFHARHHKKSQPGYREEQDELCDVNEEQTKGL